MAHINRFSLVSLMALGFAMPAIAQNVDQTTGPQETTGPQAVDRMQRDVVVVTAQKREETVQDIAIAVTAITSELRDEIGLTTVQDYTNFAPGLTYSTSNDRLGMRGVTRTSNNFGIRSGISNYIDGVYFSSAIPAGRAPLFVERVEVVRGPQGTLYGRDSIGGALNLISKRPASSFEGQFNIGAGNFDHQKVEMTVAGPITDWLRYRVSGARYKQGEGFLHNAAGLESEGLRNDEYAVEAQLEGNIGDRFDWWAKYHRFSWTREGAPGARTGVGQRQSYQSILFGSTADVGPNGFAGLLDPNRTQRGTQNTNPAIDDPYAFNTDFTAFAHLRPIDEIMLEGIYHFDNFDLKYLGGSVYYNYNLQQDQDNSPISRFTLGGRNYISERVSDYTENRGWFSNEINLISTGDGPLNWVMGLYQYQENYNQSVFVSQIGDPGGNVARLADLQAGNFASRAPNPPSGTGRTFASGAPINGASLMYLSMNQGLNHAYGAFVQGDYAINDQWKVTAGVRWSQDVMNMREYARFISHYVLRDAIGPLFGPAAALLPVRIDATSTLGGPDPSTGVVAQGVLNANPTSAITQQRWGIYIDPVTGNAYRDMAATFEEVTGVLGLDWKPDDDTLIYAKYNRGYKPGGLGCAAVNCSLVVTPYTDKELVDAVELGFKREWRDLNLTTNATLFYYDYQGYQVSNTIVPDDPDGPAGPLPRPAPYAAYVNLPETKTTGFELETMWYPTDNLRFMLNYGWTNPEIGDTMSLVHSLDPFALDRAATPLGPAAAAPATCAPPAFSPAGAPITCRGVQGQNLKGNLLPYSPKHKVALNGTYNWYFEDGSEMAASLSYFWQDISYTDIFNRSYTKTPSWDQTDARLSWTNSDGNVTLIGFVKNMFDEVGYDSVTAGLREGRNNQVAPTLCDSTAATMGSPGLRSASSCYTTSETYRPPRTYGAELQFRF